MKHIKFSLLVALITFMSTSFSCEFIDFGIMPQKRFEENKRLALIILPVMFGLVSIPLRMAVNTIRDIK